MLALPEGFAQRLNRDVGGGHVVDVAQEKAAPVWR
jgi:hypothetical protein